ncbi:hypothetical protein TW84_02020 [Vibrio neptunius]|nr:hypothetical protein TW84_02020 [Vibrio neptunius]
MISNVTGNIVTITFTTFIFSSSILHASESEMGMKFNNNIASVRVCENEICRNIYLEYSGLNDFIDIKNSLLHMKIITTSLIPFPEPMNVGKYIT